MAYKNASEYDVSVLVQDVSNIFQDSDTQFFLIN